MADNYNTNLSIDLQRSRDKNSWTSISSCDKECSSTNIGTIGKDYYVASGYYYRVVTTINVKRGSTSVETANCIRVRLNTHCCLCIILVVY